MHNPVHHHRQVARQAANQPTRGQLIRPQVDGATLAHLHGRSPDPAALSQPRLVDLRADPIPGRLGPAQATHASSQLLIDLPVGEAGGDGQSPDHTITGLALEASRLPAPIVNDQLSHQPALAPAPGHGPGQPWHQPWPPAPPHTGPEPRAGQPQPPAPSEPTAPGPAPPADPEAS